MKCVTDTATEASLSDVDDSPVGWDDYGLFDELTCDQLAQIDEALLSLATVKAQKVEGIIDRMIGNAAHVTWLPDYYYETRVQLLVERGALALIGDAEDLMQSSVFLLGEFRRR